MTAAARDNLATLVNLAIPGAGLILVGYPWTGFVVGLLFALLANLALWAVLLVPDLFSPAGSGLAIGLAGGTYLGAQIRLVHTLRRERDAQRRARRRAALARAHACLIRGEYEQALAALEPLREEAEHDLLVAYRWAQVLTGLDAGEEARAAWRRVRALDPHGIYREQILDAEKRLSGGVGSRGTSFPFGGPA